MINFKHLYYFLTVARTGSIARAAEKLHLTPQTLSGQISAFEERVGARLFERTKRRLELSEAGQQALGYAEEIFQIGSELEAVLKQEGGQPTRVFRVGIADVVPKATAYQLLAPVLELPDQLKLICREDQLEELAAELALHRLDMVLADRPLPANMDIRGFSHPLGDCGIVFLASPQIAARIDDNFPRCLDTTPMLIPGVGSALRVGLLRWLEKRGLQPKIIGEFDDSALMSAFGQAGTGVFPVPLTVAQTIMEQFGVVEVGRTSEVRERYFAISAERRISHPAVLAVSQAARKSLSME